MVEKKLKTKRKTTGRSKTRVKGKRTHRARGYDRYDRYDEPEYWRESPHQPPHTDQYPPPPPPSPSHPPYPPYYGPPYPRMGRTSKPTIAGVLLIIAGVLGIISAVLAGFFGVLMGDPAGLMELTGEDDNADVTGSISLDDGSAAQNVTISVIDEHISTQTDANGEFRLKNVPIGNQKLKLEKEGYKTIIHKTFIVPSNDSTWDNFNPEGEEFDNDYEFILERGNETITEGEYPPFQVMTTFCYTCAVIAAILSIFSIVGGIYAMKRKKFHIVVAGAILGIFSIGFIIGAILAIIALIMIFMSKQEFMDKESSRPREDKDLYKPY